ncbi:PLP-dependent aminotransferase family protein [Bradyrhizobium sp. ARR65]|uniref:MocR-like pyridoxine biosynthesis transcription factor PdxR n=1 Tax=Bradyrhizobium sp. ARR65 TaxID=1040989 RepID=UPI0004658CBA|nr:PLP-dependent aminotransferase family protein [Bradyrhizobium sp. ARR65]
MQDVLAGLVDIELSPNRSETLTHQLANALREAILKGALLPGRRLPSSREVARQLKVSRNTVSSVVDQLAMEGYLEVAQGRRPVIAAQPLRLARGKSISATATLAPRTSRWAKHLQRSNWPFRDKAPPRPFQTGIGDAREFPHDLWARCLRRAARSAATRQALSINSPALQSALLRHLVIHRGVRAQARQLMVMPSAQAAIELIARVVLDAGDLAWMESPGYGGAHAAFEAAGGRVAGTSLDRAGLVIESGSGRPRLIFVTPSHQYPTGRLMSINRRRQLLAFAASVGALIIEDDYDSEFHYDGRPVAALQGLDEAGCVFYVGTFSKSTFADIRLGYVLVPEAYVDIFGKAQRHSGQIGAAPLQEALAEFIDDGHFAAHIRKMTRIYRERRDHLVRALHAVAGDWLKIDPPSGGMQLVASLGKQIDDHEVAGRMVDNGISLRPLSPHFLGRVTERGLFLGFAAWNAREIEKGAERIGAVLRQYRR